MNSIESYKLFRILNSLNIFSCIIQTYSKVVTLKRKFKLILHIYNNISLFFSTTQGRTCI